MPPSTAWNYLATEEAYEIRGDLIDAAIQSRRLDLIDVCFRRSETGIHTSMAIDELENGEFKDKLVIMVLKTDSSDLQHGFWPIEEIMFDGRQVIAGGYVREALIEVLRSHFPDFPADAKPLDTRASRLELAARLEKKLGITVDVANSEETRPRPLPDPSQSVPTPNGEADGMPPTTLAKPKPAPDGEQPPGRPWLIPGAILLAILAALGGWLARREK